MGYGECISIHRLVVVIIIIVILTRVLRYRDIFAVGCRILYDSPRRCMMIDDNNNIIWTTNNNNKYYYICFMARKAYTYITYNIIHMCIMLADGWRRRNRNNMCTPHNMYIIIILYTRYRLKTAGASTAYTRYLYYNVIT